MAEDPIRKYSDAIGELEKARGKIAQLEEIIGRMYSYLATSPYELMISNVSSVGFPVEVTFGKNVNTFNGSDWPQIQQIAEALANLHGKRKIVEEAWHGLSDIDKNLVSPPPEKK